MSRSVRLVALLLAALAGPPAAQEPLRVATKASPPFAFQDGDDEWIGISIDLWRDVADGMELDFEWVEVARVDEMLAGVRDGKFDAAISAVTVTAEREESLDFSHPYYTTGLGVAVRGHSGSGLGRILAGVLSWEFLTLFGSVILGLIGAGYCFWLVEHKRNQAFQGKAREGVTTGMWWSTIMLLGHKGVHPATATGRLLAVSSMIVSILLLSVLTGAIASALTVGHFEVLIRDQNDLRHVRTLAVDGSSSADYLRRKRITFSSIPSVAAGLEAVAAERADAFVHDAPLLEHEVFLHHRDQLQVLPRTFEPQDYAVVLPQGSELREPINKALLELRASPRWEQISFHYLHR